MNAEPFFGSAEKKGLGKAEWAIAWTADHDGFFSSYCNTIPTPEGGTHENGLRSALVRGLKAHGERVGNKRAAVITAEDVVVGAAIMLSVFIRDPEFQGQTKDRLAISEAARLADSAFGDAFEHLLACNTLQANKLLFGPVHDPVEKLVGL